MRDLEPQKGSLRNPNPKKKWVRSPAQKGVGGCETLNSKKRVGSKKNGRVRKP